MVPNPIDNAANDPLRVPIDDPLAREGSWPSRPGLVRQAHDAILAETPAPIPHRVPMHAKLGRYRLVAETVRGVQDHAVPIRHQARHPVTPNLTLQKRPFLVDQDQHRQVPSHTTWRRHDFHANAPTAANMILNSVPKD